MTFNNFNTLASTNPLNTAVATPVYTIFALRDPTTSDNAYQPATEWQNQVTGKFWKLVFTGQGPSQNALWIMLTGGIVPAMLTLTGNSGGPVSPNGMGNINVVGDGITITIAGNPGTNTLTASLIGGGPAIERINGDVGFITGNNVTIFANNATNNSGATVLFNNAATISTLNVTDVNGNTLVGKLAGGSLGGVSNSGFGNTSLAALAASDGNAAFGSASLASLTNGLGRNCAFGGGCLNSLLTGTQNTAIGEDAGVNYTGAESHNIIIGNNAGTTGESRVTRIGEPVGGGSQLQCFIAGIAGNSVMNKQMVTINTVTAQLGSDPIAMTALLTITTVTNGMSPYTVLPTDQFLACQSSTGAITILLPNAPTTGQVFYIKDSSGMAATNNITVTTVGGVVNIDGMASQIIDANFQSVTVVFDGTKYEIF